MKDININEQHSITSDVNVNNFKFKKKNHHAWKWHPINNFVSYSVLKYRNVMTELIK